MVDLTIVVHIEEWPIYRKGFAALISDTAEFSLLGSGSNLHDAVTLAQNHRPAIIVLDINISGNGLEAAKILSRRHPESRLVFLTASERSEHVYAAMHYGAAGYLLKTANPDEIIEGRLAVRAGKRHVSPKLASKHFTSDGRSPLDLAEVSGDWAEQKFTARENDVVHLLTDGHTNREIAAQLSIAEKTVKHHVTVIMQKLQVRNRVEATRVILKRMPPFQLP